MFIGPPDAEERIDIFKVHCKKIKLLDKIDYAKLAEITNGFSCADIAVACTETAKNVWLKSGERKQKVTTEDFIRTIKHMKRGSGTVKDWLGTAKARGVLLPDEKSGTSHSNMFG